MHRALCSIAALALLAVSQPLGGWPALGRGTGFTFSTAETRGDAELFGV